MARHIFSWVRWQHFVSVTEHEHQQDISLVQMKKYNMLYFSYGKYSSATSLDPIASLLKLTQTSFDFIVSSLKIRVGMFWVCFFQCRDMCMHTRIHTNTLIYACMCVHKCAPASRRTNMNFSIFNIISQPSHTPKVFLANMRSVSQWQICLKNWTCCHTTIEVTDLLLLCSQLYLWGSPFWVRFLHVWPFFHPTIEVVKFHLHGWCMLGVFLLPAFNCLGHEC